MGLNSISLVSIKEEKTETQIDIHKENTEAEIEVLQLQVKEHLEQSEARKGKKNSSPRGLGGSMVLCQHLSFKIPASRTMKELISAVLSRQVCGALLQKN